LATGRALPRLKCNITGHHSEPALPDVPPELQPAGLTRADLVGNLMGDLVARETLSGIAPSEAELQSSHHASAMGDV